jgi:hypothetical protein
MITEIIWFVIKTIGILASVFFLIQWKGNHKKRAKNKFILASLGTLFLMVLSVV